ncbi:ATP-binding protein [Streptomyces sp. NPDC090493]|uniref:ATP-binding protein n=1 Tax=Streptomyces sp. NPDC090493 TaxID=3365964 RepID=UPI00382B9B6D
MGTLLDQALSSIGEDPLIGRERETGRLRTVLTTRTHPGPWLLEITGDPGIGKTRLLAEWSGLAERAGLTVLSGRVAGADRQLFGVFRAPVVRALELPGVAEAIRADDRALLLRCFAAAHGKEAGDGGEPGPGEGQDRPAPGLPDRDRARLRRCIADLLWAAAGDGRRLALSLDDLQWADDESVELLSHLLRHPRPGTSLILACSVRPRQRSSALTACLADPDDAFRVERLRLGPLPRGTAGELSGLDATAERQRFVYEAADGNPLYLRVLSRSPGPLVPPGGITPWVLSDEAVMAAATVVARELAPLNAVEQDVLRAAAVLGEEFDPAHLAELADRDPVSTTRALDRLIALDLVRADHTQVRRCRLRHPVLRAVVYRGAPHGWRRAAHARADRVLREAGADPVHRAPHVARCAEPGDQDAVRLLTEAAEQVCDTDPVAAASWLRTALSLIREDGEGLRVRLTTSLARSLGAIGQLRECRELLRRIPRPPDAPHTRVDTELVAFHAMVERHLGDYGRAESLLTAELALLAEGEGGGADGTELSSPLRLELSTVSLLRRAFPRSRALAEEVLRHATDVHDRHLRMAATVRLSHCSAFAGDVPTLLHRAREAGALVDSTGDTELTPHLDTVSQLGWAEALAERHHDALRHTARGIRLARAAGQLFVLPYLGLAHAYASVSVGRLTDALRSAECAEEDAHRMERPALLGFALALRAWATALLDGPDVASPIAERAVQELGAGGRLWAVTAGVLADVRLDQGRPGESLELIRSAMEHDRHPGTARSITPIWYSHAARSAAALGDRDQAAKWARRASFDADLLGLPGQRGYAALARAHSTPDPVGPLREAVSGFQTGGLVPMECRARLLLATELASRGSRAQTHELEQALEQANRAKSLAEASGARRLYRDAVDVQRRLGARRPRPAREAETPLPEMSEREREIVRMVALGMSNNDIARLLVVSPKTVEAHLTRIFRKAGVRSRVALVAALPNAAPEPGL